MPKYPGIETDEKHILDQAQKAVRQAVWLVAWSGDLVTANAIMAAAVNVWPRQFFFTMMLDWIDALGVGLGYTKASPENDLKMVGWIDAQTGEKTSDPDKVPRHAIFARNMIVARLTKDDGLMNATLDAFQDDDPADQDAWTNCVMFLLESCQLTLRHVMRTGVPPGMEQKPDS